MCILQKQLFTLLKHTANSGLEIVNKFRLLSVEMQKTVSSLNLRMKAKAGWVFLKPNIKGYIFDICQKPTTRP